MTIVNGAKIGGEICDALGLHNVIDLKIDIDLKNIAMVTATYYPDEEHLRNFVPILSKYKLVPKED